MTMHPAGMSDGDWDEAADQFYGDSPRPKIFVFCNNCSHEWHEFTALAEDGVFLAGHICSDHGYAPHDMGVREDGWKRDIYARHFPHGFEVVLVENPREHAGVRAAHAKHLAHDKDEYAAKIARLSDDPARARRKVTR